MPGDIFAIATTFSTVVLDGPYMCSAEMQASISRWRCRLRELRARAGLGAAERVFLREPTLGETTNE
ncbi:MAG TPA: hypothetical protein VK251_12910 [Steroidobacteraceae bacterium]|nr:hypothetical protein [Steroidobacteraceae bacterium]